MGCLNGKRELPPNLTQSQIDLIKLNTGQRDDEIRKWYKEFYEISNGETLNESYFIKYYQDLLPYKGDSEDFCKLVFNKLDKDESDSLDFSEILIGFAVLSKGDPNERLKWMFSLYDQNNDGFIDNSELKTAVKAILIMTDRNFENDTTKVNKIVETLLKNIDKNNDQKINLNEFLNATMDNQILRSLLCPSFA